MQPYRVYYFFLILISIYKVHIHARAHAHGVSEKVAGCVFTHPYKELTPKKVGRKPQKVGRKPLSLPNSTGQGQLLEGEEKS